MTLTHILHSPSGRIIFVEDVKALTDEYHRFFEIEGYDFMTTMDIDEALVNTEFEQPDAVLLDIAVIPPGHSSSGQGYRYLEAIKKNPKTKDIPIIIFTNLDNPQDRQKCRDMGAAAYIFKRECAPREVIAAVAEIIKRSREGKG